jgi:hypothetical protein
MTLHSHKVDDSTFVEDGDDRSRVPAGWQIAVGDADDIRVCGAHPWQSHCLVFANGDRYGTAMCWEPSHIGKNSLLQNRKNSIFLTPENRKKIWRRRQSYTGCARGENKGWF